MSPKIIQNGYSCFDLNKATQAFSQRYEQVVKRVTLANRVSHLSQGDL